MKNVTSAETMKRNVPGIAVFSLLVLAVLVFNPILSAQDSQQPDPTDRQVDQELMPLLLQEAVYPPEAAADGIEGWVQVSFTITDDGAVQASSVSIVDADPAGVFEDSALSAIQQFRFQPRIVAGEAQTIPGVQYVFRYNLND